MSHPARRAGGLYGGLQFSNSLQAPPGVHEVDPIPEPAAPAAVAVENSPATQAEELAKPSAAGWSASLAFAPARRAPGKAKPRPAVVAAAIPPAAILLAASTAIVEAAPVLHDVANASNQAQASTSATSGGGWGKKVKPPSMVLDEDINGYRGQGGGGGSKKNRKKKKSQQQQQHQYDPHEQYDPMRPNDYNEYKRFRAEQVAKRSTKRVRSEDEEDVWEDRDRYNARAKLDDVDAFVPSFSPPPPSTGPAATVSTTMTGDEAYARRLAMSQGLPYIPTESLPPKSPSPPPSGAGAAQDMEDEDDWRPRAGLGGGVASLARPSQAPSFALASRAPVFASASVTPPAASEQYFAAPRQATAVAPTVAADPDDDDLYGDLVPEGPASTLIAPAVPFMSHAMPTIGGGTTAPGLGLPPTLPDTMPLPPFMFAPGLPPPPGPGAAVGPPSNDVVDAARAKAAAIAARLAKLVPPPADSAATATPAAAQGESDGPDHRPDPHGFAARLMAKWGHVAGQGIGARPDEAIVVPLMVQATNETSGKGKRQSEHEERPARVGMGSSAKGAMGKILNANDNVGKEDMAKFGRPSRVVVLSNMVDPTEIQDEELRGEIGDECAKYGGVERVLPHLCSNGTVRVFVQYGGQPAAWKCVRELDGRFFGGQTVRARYYDEKRWAKGDLEWSWE